MCLIGGCSCYIWPTNHAARPVTLSTCLSGDEFLVINRISALPYTACVPVGWNSGRQTTPGTSKNHQVFTGADELGQGFDRITGNLRFLAAVLEIGRGTHHSYIA